MADADSDKKPSDGSLTWLRWVVPLLLVAFLLASEALGDRKVTSPGIDYSSFYTLAQQGSVQRVAISGQSVTGTLKAPAQVDGKTIKDFTTTLPAQPDPQLLPLLRDQQVSVRAEENQPSFWGPLLLTMLPWALVIGAWVWIAKRARGSIGIGGPAAEHSEGATEALRAAGPRASPLRRRGGPHELEARPAGGGRVSAYARALPAPRRQAAARRAARRPARYGQDAPRPRRRRRGRGAVLLRQRLGVHPALRRRRRLARARSVRRGEGGCSRRSCSSTRSTPSAGRAGRVSAGETTSASRP